MTWQAIAAGANGIAYYAFHEMMRYMKGAEFDRHWDVICSVAREVKDREEILVSDGYPGGVKGDCGMAVARAWRCDDGAWLLLVNPTRSPIVASPVIGAWTETVRLAPLECRWIRVVTYPIPRVCDLDFVRAADEKSACAAARRIAEAGGNQVLAAPRAAALAAKRACPSVKVCLVATPGDRVEESYDVRTVRDGEAFAAIAAKIDYLEFDRDYPDDVAAALHDAGVKTIKRLSGEEGELQAAADLGVKYVVTDAPGDTEKALRALARRMQEPGGRSGTRIRDPFILADAASRTYYMYETTPWNVGRGVQVRTSSDLETWSAPSRVMTMPASAACFRVCAPEVHAYKGRYYMFATAILRPDPAHPITSKAEDPNFRPPECYPLTRSGTWIFVADRPEGPFVQLSDMSATPHDFMALDGTLVVDPDLSPWMVYSCEWTQMQVGRMMAARLKEDLSGLAAPPKEIFRADVAFGDNYVTDGPFCYRSPKTGRLFMIWSKFCGKSYSVLSCESQTGCAAGPWRDFKILFADNGGHGMIFRTFDGDLLLAMHKPEVRGHERLALFPVEDKGDAMAICGSPR